MNTNEPLTSEQTEWLRRQMLALRKQCKQVHPEITDERLAELYPLPGERPDGKNLGLAPATLPMTGSMSYTIPLSRERPYGNDD